MKIYKYASFDTGELILEGKRVLLNNPDNYNDPFDCSLKPLKEDEEECYKRIVNYYLFKTFASIIENENVDGIPSFVRFELRLFKKAMKKTPYYDKMPVFDGMMKLTLKKYGQKNPKFKKELEENKKIFLKEIKEKTDEIRKNILVTCFSKTHNSILLWSHYGCGHRGLCIEFDANPKSFENVKYRKKRQHLDLKLITAVVLGYDFIGEKADSNNPKIMSSISKALLTKAKDWKYESEVRIVQSAKEYIPEFDQKTNEYKYYLSMNNITKVYVGCKVSKEQVEQLRSKYPNLEIVQMKESDYKYELEEMPQS